MLRIQLMCTVSHPILNYMLDKMKAEELRKDPKYDKWMKHSQKERYARIFRERPFQPMFP